MKRLWGCFIFKQFLWNESHPDLPKTYHSETNVLGPLSSGLLLCNFFLLFFFRAFRRHSFCSVQKKAHQTQSFTLNPTVKNQTTYLLLNFNTVWQGCRVHLSQQLAFSVVTRPAKCMTGVLHHANVWLDMQSTAICMAKENMSLVQLN